jgi:hypothetical protein
MVSVVSDAEVMLATWSSTSMMQFFSAILTTNVDPTPHGDSAVLRQRLALPTPSSLGMIFSPIVPCVPVRPPSGCG